MNHPLPPDIEERLQARDAAVSRLATTEVGQDLLTAMVAAGAMTAVLEVRALDGVCERLDGLHQLVGLEVPIAAALEQTLELFVGHGTGDAMPIRGAVNLPFDCPSLDFQRIATP